jgi:hypothetical protein
MRGNIVLAAAVFAVGVVLGAGVLVLGFRWALTDAADHLNVAIEKHGEMTQRGAERAGQPIQAALDQVATRVAEHAGAIKEAGQTIGHSKVKIDGAVPILDQVPIRVQGTRGDDRSLPVDVQIQK